MFWRHKESVDKPLLLIGVASLLVIIILAFVALRVLSSVKKSNESANFSIPKEDQLINPALVAVQLTQEYQNSLLKLKSEISAATPKDFDSVLKKIINDFFEIRVPKEMIGKHFEVMLRLKRLSEQVGEKDRQKEAVDALETLLKQSKKM